MILLFDIGNTHTHIGLADARRVLKQTDIPTLTWFGGGAPALVRKFAGKNEIAGAALCSVVPRATPLVRKAVRSVWRLDALALNSKTIRGVGVDYPLPASIGPDRLANAVAARRRFGAPVVVVDLPRAVAGIYPLLVVGGTVPATVPALSGVSGKLVWGGTGNKTLSLTIPTSGTMLMVQ